MDEFFVDYDPPSERIKIRREVKYTVVKPPDDASAPTTTATKKKEKKDEKAPAATASTDEPAGSAEVRFGRVVSREKESRSSSWPEPPNPQTIFGWLAVVLAILAVVVAAFLLARTAMKLSAVGPKHPTISTLPMTVVDSPVKPAEIGISGEIKVTGEIGHKVEIVGPPEPPPCSAYSGKEQEDCLWWRKYTR